MSVELPTGLWLRTKEVASALCISKATLHRRKAEGYLNLGTHFIKTGPTDRSNLLWNVDACRKVLGAWEALQLEKASNG